MAVCGCSSENHFPEGRATGNTPDDHGYKAASTEAVVTITLETGNVFNAVWIMHHLKNSMDVCQACLDAAGGLHGLRHTTWTTEALT